MKKIIFAACTLFIVILVATSCSYTKHNEFQNKTLQNEQIANTNVELPAQNNVEIEYKDYSEIPSIGGSDYTFSRKFVDEVYNIQIAAEVVGKEKRNEWVNNVFLKKTAEEQSALPTLYQMIVDLNIPKEELIEKNNEYIDFPDQYIPMEIINSLYNSDVKTVKQELKSPLALYYDGEIYTFDELSKNTGKINIPKSVLGEYFEYIEIVCERNNLTKYMQESITAAKNAYNVSKETIK